jgi:hypothetical protein
MDKCVMPNKPVESVVQQESRDKFEKWFGEPLWDGFQRDHTGIYYSREARRAWEIWQAALESSVPRQETAAPCGEFVCSVIAGASWIECGLPKGHEGEHRGKGTCFKHGEYFGEIGAFPQCPKWPECIGEAGSNTREELRLAAEDVVANIACATQWEELRDEEHDTYRTMVLNVKSGLERYEASLHTRAEAAEQRNIQLTEELNCWRNKGSGVRR